ncbi:MAG: hypothetical protein CM15mP112_02320 [Flavobacteriales bacterium]|nr:MAG: hypothetical protein CM15mP112_02320 [Flavobacteriales bacterium]
MDHTALVIIDGDDKSLKSSFKNVIKKDVLDKYYSKYIKMIVRDY